jgi:hypothetical protein
MRRGNGRDPVRFVCSRAAHETIGTNALRGSLTAIGPPVEAF